MKTASIDVANGFRNVFNMLYGIEMMDIETNAVESDDGHESIESITLDFDTADLFIEVKSNLNIHSAWFRDFKTDGSSKPITVEKITEATISVLRIMQTVTPHVKVTLGFIEGIIALEGCISVVTEAHNDHTVLVKGPGCRLDVNSIPSEKTGVLKRFFKKIGKLFEDDGQSNETGVLLTGIIVGNAIAASNITTMNAINSNSNSSF